MKSIFTLFRTTRTVMKFSILVKVIAILGVLRSTLGAIETFQNPKELQECLDEMNEFDDEIVGELAMEGCKQAFLWNTAKQRWHQEFSPLTLKYFDSLWSKYSTKANIKRAAKGNIRKPCVRREIRQLKPAEWDRVTTCLNDMKNDKSLKPNKYEAIARVHNRIADQSAHRGQAFLAWHTVYLLFIEFALRECDSKICLPYWDTRLDANLRDPRKSVIFSLIGGTNGRLSSPFKDWTFVNNEGNKAPILREAKPASDRGLLMNYQEYQRLSQVRSTNDMVQRATTKSHTIIELQHDQIHNYVSGTISQIWRAAQDPLFFFIHGFVDCIFDRNLKKLGRVRRKRYPGTLWGRGYPSGQGPNSRIANIANVTVGGLARILQNKDAYSPAIRKYVKYAASPQCRNNCATPGGYLYCDRNINRCVSKVMSEGSLAQESHLILSESSENRKRSARVTDVTLDDSVRTPIQNDFLLDGVSDSSLWVYVAVSVTHYRAIGDHFNSFSMKNGRADETMDIYQPLSNNAFKTGNAKTFRDCQPSLSGSMYVYVKTDGLNYNGHYEDYAIVDNRLPIHTTESYVAIKKPDPQSNTRVIVTAYDECGRLCTPVCPTINGANYSYRPCDGIVEIDNRPPRLHSDTIPETMQLYWNLNGNVPQQRNHPYFMKFVCSESTYFSKHRNMNK